MSIKKLDLVAINTDDGKYYISHKKEIGICRGSTLTSLVRYLFDGKSPETTFKNEWVCVSSKPKEISLMTSQLDINHRYELQDKSLISKNLPEFISRNDVAEYMDYEWEWKENMVQYRSLYKEISDKQPDVEVKYDFDLDIILSTSKVVDPIKMNYTIPKTQYKKDGTVEITEQDVCYQLADQVILPSILLTQRHCKISSKQSYDIVRQYIKDYIDPMVATITSDYDFCFTVKRRIKLAEIIKYTVDVNNNDIFQKRKRKPKYVKREQDEKTIICFEMTHEESNYKGHTPINGFKANNQSELKDKIDNYCKKLVSFINTKIEECTTCCGNGVIINNLSNNKKDN